MGSLAARDMAAHADRTTALRWHLQHNHFPPIPSAMIPVAAAAMEAIEDEDHDRLIGLPEGVTDRLNRTASPAHFIAGSLHLYDLLTPPEEEEEL